VGGVTLVKIGIAYDTHEMYEHIDKTLHLDFATEVAIAALRTTINSLGYRATLLGNTQHIATLLKNDSLDVDIVYNTVEGIGSRNREGLLPALLEIHNVPYIGTDAFGLSLTLDKVLTKLVAERLRIQTPRHYAAELLTSVNTIREALEKLKTPSIVKPNNQGNSSGIKVFDSAKEASEYVCEALEKYSTTILCEEFIIGKEITVPLIGNNADSMLIGVTSVDIQGDNGYFWLDSDQKLYGDYNNILLNLPDKQNKMLIAWSVALFNAIGCRDFARFDYRLADDGAIYFIEVNPLPSLFHGGAFHIVGKSHRLTYAQTIDKIIQTACDRLAIPRI